MADEKRVTDFGFQDISLVNDKIVKIRPLTFKEKREYLDLIAQLKEVKEEEFAQGYLKMQIEIAFFVISRLNPEVTREEVESGINGEVLKKILDVAFYDPFATFLGK